MKQYQKVIVNGYKGVVQRPYGEGMYEVRLRSGEICVDENSLTLITDEEYLKLDK